MSRKQQLLDAAVEVFASNGFEASTVDQVALAAGVSVGTLYNYFASKEEILRSIVLREFATRRCFLPSDSVFGGVGEIVAAFVAKHLRYVLGSPSASRVVLQEKRLVQLWQQTGQLPMQGMASLLQGVLAEETSEVKAEMLAKMLHGAVEGITQHLLEMPREAALEKVEDVATLFHDFVQTGLK